MATGITVNGALDSGLDTQAKPYNLELHAVKYILVVGTRNASVSDSKMCTWLYES